MEVQVGDTVYCWFPLEEREELNEYNEPFIISDDILFGNYRKGIVKEIADYNEQHILVDFLELKDFNINSEIWFYCGISSRFNYLNSKDNNLFISILPPKILIKRYKTKTKQILEELNYVDMSIMNSNLKISKKFESFKNWAKSEIEKM